MRIITPWSLLLGLLLAGPALAQAWSDPGADIAGAMMRFVLGTLVAGVGLAIIGGLVELYRPDEAENVEAQADAEQGENAAPLQDTTADEAVAA